MLTLGYQSAVAGRAFLYLSIYLSSAQGAEPEDIKYNSRFVTRSGGVLKRSLRSILSRTTPFGRYHPPPVSHALRASLLLALTRARQTIRNRRRASGIAHFHHTPAHPIYWEDCVDTGAAVGRPQ
jgi:hypothetical protein